VSGALPRRVVVSRVVHGAIALVFLLAIAELWWAALSGDTTWLTAVAIVLLVAEGVLFAAAGGHCPLGPVWRRLGDETPFFDVVLGPRLGRRAVPVLGLVAVAGLVVLGARLLS
jgi:hypothetical protein